MRLLLDRKSIALFTHLSSARVGDGRRYYSAVAPYRIVMVVRYGFALSTLVNRVIDARVGWDSGMPGFCRLTNEGKQHTKITLYRPLSVTESDKRLSDVIRQAPRDEED